MKKTYYRKDIFIIVTVDSAEIYCDIRRQLIALNYKEFYDFIPRTIYKKKMALAYGNCYMLTVKMYLEHSREYRKKYGFYPLPMIQDIKDLDFSDIVSHADIVFHQSIREDNSIGKHLSSENFLKTKNDTCITVAVPNLYNQGHCFFPQFKYKSTEKRLLKNSLIVDFDTRILEWYRKGYSKSTMIKKIKDGGVFDFEEIQKDWSQYLDKLYSREKEWDIKISDYIIDNYKTKKLWYEPYHISTELAREIANRILNMMGYKSIDCIVPLMDDYEVFIYEDVKKALNMVYEEKTIRNHTYARSTIRFYPMNIEDYVELYVNIFSMNQAVRNNGV